MIRYIANYSDVSHTQTRWR